jgi:hypothetical protein
MKRRLLNLLTVLSLLLAVAVAVVWAWSYDTWRLGVARGRIVLLVTEGPDGEAYVQRFLRHDSPAAQPWEDLRTRATHSTALAGFEHHRGQFADYTSVFEFSLLAVPLWPLVVLALALPAVRIWLGRRERRRARQGRCRECGYDLRGSPGRCPECGHAPAGEAAP